MKTCVSGERLILRVSSINSILSLLFIKTSIMRPHEISRSNLYKIVGVERQRSVNVDFGMDGVSGHKGSQVRGHMHGDFKAVIGW